jgi:hypothetical protein
MLCSSPAVKLDDLARWWIGPDGSKQNVEPQAANAEATEPKPASRTRERDQIVDEVLKGMARRAARQS